jgi:hypothetical protein
MANNPVSKGIGHGAAQVFDTSAPIDLAIALDQSERDRAVKQKAAAQKAADELKGKYLDLKDKRGFYTRDSKSIMEMWNTIDDKFAGRWEQVATDPTMQKEYYDELRNMNMLLDQSEEQKEYLKLLQTLHDQDASKPEDQRLFTIEQRGILEDLYTNPEYLANPDKFLEQYNEARKPQQNLPNAIDYAIEKIPFAKHLKASGYSVDKDGKNISGSSTQLDQAAYKNALVTYGKTDPVMIESAKKAGYVDDNGEVDMESYSNDVLLQYSTQQVESSVRDLSGRGGKIVFKPEEQTTLEYNFPVTKVMTKRVPWTGTEKISEKNEVLSFPTGVQLPATIDMAIPFTSDTRNLSYDTGKSPSLKVNPKTSYSQIVYGDYNGKKGLYAIGVTSESYTDDNTEKVVKDNATIIRPYNEVKDVLIQNYGINYVNDMEKYLTGGGKIPKSASLPSGDDNIEMR